ELIRRIDGRRPGRFVAEEIAGPLELEFWIGLPEQLEPRVARLVAAPGYGLTHAGDGPGPLFDAIYGTGQLDFNDPRVHRAELPHRLLVRAQRAAQRERRRAWPGAPSRPPQVRHVRGSLAWLNGAQKSRPRTYRLAERSGGM